MRRAATGVSGHCDARGSALASEAAAAGGWNFFRTFMKCWRKWHAPHPSFAGRPSRYAARICDGGSARGGAFAFVSDAGAMGLLQGMLQCCGGWGPLLGGMRLLRATFTNETAPHP